MITDLKYNEPVEVTERQYKACVKFCSGDIAHRIDSKTGKFYIKLWAIRYKKEVLQILKMFS